jgi:NADH:ubiquinone oxidoreductase subunit 3 (subunit A)
MTKSKGSTEIDITDNSKFQWLASRPFEKSFGICILVLYLRLVSILHGESSISFPSSIYAWLVFGCSLLNVVSHTAVLANLLNDGLVLSILVGVIFDVASSLLYLWCCRHNQLSYVLLLWSTGNLVMHVRALFLYTSWDNMKSVVTSATNNLRGEPGPFGLDHVFAYSDTGNHLAFFLLAVRETIGNDSLPRTVAMSALILGPAILLIRNILQPHHNEEEEEDGNESAHRKTPSARLTAPPKRHMPVCDCKACRCQTSFSIAPHFCELWFCTFQELLGKIEQGRKVVA